MSLRASANSARKKSVLINRFVKVENKFPSAGSVKVIQLKRNTWENARGPSWPIPT
jgi:hypothetical protein